MAKYAQPGWGRGEQDPLLELPGEVKGRTPRDVHGKEGFGRNAGSARRVILVALMASLIDWLAFTIWAIVFLIGYHAVPQILLHLAGALMAVCSVCAVALWFMGGPTTRIMNRKRSVICASVAVFTLAGSVVGTSVYLSKCHDYWSFHTRRHYTNVSPDEPAAGHLDASAIVFMQGARPDISRAMSYRRYKTIYCVAPMALDETYSSLVETVSSDVQYWAAGKDCCGTSQGYTCGSVKDAKARAGLVITDMTGEDAIMKGMLSDDDISNYEQAVLMAMAKFDMTSPEERIYLHFEKDLEAAVQSELSVAIRSLVAFIFASIPFCLAAGIVVVLVAAEEHVQDLVNCKHQAFSTLARIT